MKVEDFKWYCPQPFVSLFTDTSGVYKPCCVMHIDEQMKGDFYWLAKTNTHSPKEFYQSEPMKGLRQAMKIGDFQYLNKFCKVCVDKEKIGVRSARQMYNEQFRYEYKDKRAILDDVVNKDYPTFFYSVEPTSLITDFCNLSCNMCTIEISSGVRNESVALHEIANPKARVAKHTKEFYSQLEYALNHCCEVKLVGGETVLSPNLYFILDLIKDPSDINLKISTNGTSLPKKFIDYCKKFRQVFVSFSLEGVGKVNEYIRYPSKWNKVKKNLDIYRTFAFVNIAATVNALNVSHVHKLKKLDPDVSYTMVTNNFYSLNSVPPIFIDKYLNILYQNRDIDIIKFFEKDYNFNDEDMIRMLMHIRRRDKLRNTNLLSVFPEWRPYYENICS
jgi:hypothetical protein